MIGSHTPRHACAALAAQLLLPLQQREVTNRLL
jgi:hypothetical protein